MDAPLFQGGTSEAESQAVDVGALARSLRPPTSVAALVLWWSVFMLLAGTCLYPHPAAVSAAWVFAIAFALGRGARRRAFLNNLATLPRLSRDAPAVSRTEWPNVTVIVPARDEESTVEGAARSLAALPYPNLAVWFVNDHSTDRTPEILNAVQQEFPHVHVLHDPQTDSEWFGKSNAIWQAFLRIERDSAAHSPAIDPRWLLFADADVVFEPGILEQAVALAERDRLDFLTCMPKLITKTWAEQLVLPTGWRGIAQGADYQRMNDSNAFPIGIGAFMLVKHSTYKAFGGHRALSRWHPEDTLMAAAVKHIGGRVGFAWSPDLLHVRFYDGYRDVKKNTLRKTRIFFGDHVQLPLTMMAMRLSTTIMALPMIAAGVLPQLIEWRFDVELTLLALAGAVLYTVEVREYSGVNNIAEFHSVVPWLHPISGLLRVWFALSLFTQIIMKTPMDWRGRREFGISDFTA